jgi:PadR family transcriptional regulator PadR
MWTISHSRSTEKFAPNSTVATKTPVASLIRKSEVDFTYNFYFVRDYMSKGTFLGEFEQVVLLAVQRLRRDGYGMSIRREIEGRTGRSVSIGAIYATLERLQRKGFVASREGEATPVRGGRARRHFELLPEGGTALLRSRGMLDSMWEDVDIPGSSEAS